jgi:hypothetical protein
MLAHAFGGSTLVSRSRVGLVGIVASLSVGALLALGCGSKKSEKASPAGPAAGETNPAAPKPPEEEWSATLPADFPTDLPIYPGATVSKAIEVPGKNLKAGWTTADEPNKVASYYTDAFTGQGWSTQRLDRDNGTLVFADKPARSAMIGIGTSNGKTTIDLLAVEMH